MDNEQETTQEQDLLPDEEEERIEAAIRSLMIVPPPSDIDAMLNLMNLSRKIYDSAQTREVRVQADRQFNRCYDWFVRLEIPITYDARRKQWKRDTKQ
jgi:hypothetical protein